MKNENASKKCFCKECVWRDKENNLCKCEKNSKFVVVSDNHYCGYGKKFVANPFLKKDRVAQIKTAYPKGTKIKLMYMFNEPQMKEGLLGTVYHVDDIGQVHMHWENGSSLALDLVNGMDEFEVLSPVKVKITRKNIVKRKGNQND